MKQKRKIFLVDRAVQGGLAKRLCLHWAVFFAVLIIIQFWTSRILNPFMPFNELLKEMMQTNQLFMLSLILLLPSFVYDAVKVSNRFAGPIVRMRRELERAAETGEFKKISFRKGDFWESMADAYNKMIDRAKKDIELAAAADPEANREKELV